MPAGSVAIFNVLRTPNCAPATTSARHSERRSLDIQKIWRLSRDHQPVSRRAPTPAPVWPGVGKPCTHSCRLPLLSDEYDSHLPSGEMTAAHVAADGFRDHGLDLSRGGVEKHNVLRRSCLERVEDDRQAVRRPVHGVLEHQIRRVELRFRLRAVERLDEELLTSGSIGGEHEAAAIGRPDRRIVPAASGRERHTRPARRSTSHRLDSDAEAERTAAAFVPSGEMRSES